MHALLVVHMCESISFFPEFYMHVRDMEIVFAFSRQFDKIA